MSAWMVDKVHIDLMVAVARRGLKPGESRWKFRAYDWQFQQHMVDDADALGLMLARENVRSLIARYGEGAAGPGPVAGRWTRLANGDDDNMVHWDVEGYRFVDPDIELSFVEAYKLIHCYTYQSCESSDWETTEAYAFSMALEKALLYGTVYGSRSQEYRDHNVPPGWDDAPWTWHDNHVAGRLIFEGKLDKVRVVPQQ